MNRFKRKRLESSGWKVGSGSDFLGLSPVESAFVELKLALAGELKRLRERASLTQAEAASHLGSSQSRVAKMEAGDPSVSLDLLLRSALALGASRRDLARVVGRKPKGGTATNRSLQSARSARTPRRPAA